MEIPFLGGVDIAPLIYSYANMAMYLVLAVFILVGVGFFYYKYKKGEWLGHYPIKAYVWEIRAGLPVRAKPDKCRAVKDPTGAWFYELKNRKIKTMPVPFDLINPDNTIDLIALSRNELHPIRLLTANATLIKSNGTEEEIAIPKLKPIVDEAFGIAYTSLVHKNYDRKPKEDFWGKYGGFITIATVAMFSMLIIVVTLREMGAITANLSSTAATFAKVSAELAQCGGQAAAAVAGGGAP